MRCTIFRTEPARSARGADLTSNRGKNNDCRFKGTFDYCEFRINYRSPLAKRESAGITGAISGGAEHLFGKTKARGLDLFLSRLTMVLAALFIILAILVAYIVKS